MATIPVYTKQVNPVSQTAAAARAAAPEAEAFAPSAGRATARIGEDIRRLAVTEQDFALRRRKEDRAKELSRAYLAYEKEMKGLLYGKTDENGNLSDEGLLNRSLANANGITGRYVEESMRLKEKYVSAARSPEEAAWLEKAIGQTENAYMDNVSTHEIKQRREDARLHAETLERERLSEAAGIYDPAALREHIALSAELEIPLWQSQGLDGRLVEDKKKTLLLKSLNGALSNLAKTESFTAAEALLDGFKQDLPSVEYNALSRQLKDGAEKKNKNLLFQNALERFKTESGGTDFRRAMAYVQDPKTARQVGVRPEIALQVAEMIAAQMNREITVAKNNLETMEIDVLNAANEYVLNGDPAKAIDAVLSSRLDSTRKLSLVEGIKKGQAAKEDDPAVYTDLVRKIASGDVYNAVPILEAAGRGDIRQSTKNELLQNLKQKQEPSYEFYDAAVKQVSKVYNKGLLGNMTPSESAALAGALRELKLMYDNALEQKKTPQEIADLFAPEKVNAVAARKQPTLQQTGADYIKRYAGAADEAVRPRRKPGQSIEEFLNEQR